MVDHVLKGSLSGHKIIAIMYQKGDKITQRNIKVTRITQDDVEAFCYLRNQIRHFKKHNILAAMYTQ